MRHLRSPSARTLPAITGAGEAASVDIGHLHDVSRPVATPPGASVMSCPQSSYSTTDPHMVVANDGAEAYVGDQSGDAPPTRPTR